LIFGKEGRLPSDESTPFQVACMNVCDRILRRVGHEPPHFEKKPGPYGHFFTTTIDIAGHAVAIFVYEDEAEFSVDEDRIDRRFEKWDYSSGDQLIEAFGQKLSDTLQTLSAG
jgi:hypothetical protein